MVYISRKNIKTQRLTDKLYYHRISPYKINKQISKIAFRVKLPSYIKIYLTFYIFKLELAKRRNTKEKLYMLELLLD